jgi:hypothetical protein
MQVRERRRDATRAPTPASEQDTTKRIWRRPSAAVVVSTAIFVALVLVTVSAMNGGASSGRGAQHVSTAVADTSGPAILEPSRLQRGVTWIDGLTAGLILPREVTTRLAVRDPALAQIVEATWADLRSTSASDLRRAVRWIDGLAAGLILPREVTARLAVQDPELASVVQVGWSDLAPVADRGAGW